MNMYYVNFRNVNGDTLTVPVKSNAPRKAVRKARRTMNLDGQGWRTVDVVSIRYDLIPMAGTVKPHYKGRIFRHVMPWKW
jgi:hypothetical protein